MVQDNPKKTDTAPAKDKTDESLEETFPASDPASHTGVTGSEPAE